MKAQLTILEKSFKHLANQLQGAYSGKKTNIHHSAIKGQEYEKLLVETLEKCLPKKCILDTNCFIFDSNNNKAQETDIVIYSDFFPRFTIDNRHYIAEGVLSAIEVKGNLDTKSFDDALTKIEKIKKLEKRPAVGATIVRGTDYSEITKIVCGIFAFEGPKKTETIINKLNTYYKKKPFAEWVDFICINNNVYIKKNDRRQPREKQRDELFIDLTKTKSKPDLALGIMLDRLIDLVFRYLPHAPDLRIYRDLK